MKKNNFFIDATQLDPSFIDWWSEDGRVDRFNQYFANSQLLAISGYLNSIVQCWIRQELADEFLKSNPSWLEKEGREIVNAEKCNDNQSLKMFPEELVEGKALLVPCSLMWAKSHWWNYCERLFLASNHFYDIFSIDSGIAEDGRVMTELYYRLVDDKVPFAEACKLTDGITFSKYRDQELGEASNIIVQAISRLKNKERQISKPLNIGSKVVVLQLIKYKPARLDDALKLKLIGRQLEVWVDMVSANVIEILAKDSVAFSRVN
jgi:hypothetical protein